MEKLSRNNVGTGNRQFGGIEGVTMVLIICGTDGVIIIHAY